jgi:DNA-binding transcriptional ArsR family regulator
MGTPRAVASPPPPTPDPAAMRAHASAAADLLRALGNEQRLLVLCRLVEGEASVGELQDELDLSQSALSQHLARLRAAGLVATRREAQSIHYSLPPGPARHIMQTLHAIYCAPQVQATRRRTSR